MTVRGILRNTPLRVKLVALLLALVTAALTITGVASAWALHSYLLARVDGQLSDTARAVNLGVLQDALRRNEPVNVPSDYAVGLFDNYGNGGYIADRSLTRADRPPPPRSLADVRRNADQPYTTRSPNAEVRWRVLVRPLPTGENLVVAQNLADLDSAVDRLVAIEVLVGFGVLALLAAVGVTVVRTSLRPLREIESTAAAIARGDLTRRVPESHPDTEVGSLSQSLNVMLARIEAAFTAQAASEQSARAAEERMRQFVADASHELRTPLTTIRGFAELYRHGAVRDPERVSELLGRIEAEAARMGLLVEDLLLLARLDQERPLRHAPVELTVVAADSVAAARAVAPERRIGMEVAPGDTPLVVDGDDARLRQVLGNLMTNALTHTPAGTPVTVRLRADDGYAVLEVADEGPGLAPDQAARVFERFYRVDKARTRGAAGAGSTVAPHSGTGLGLAIVAALVAAHGGRVEVESTPGEGATFRVRLPLAAGAAG